MDETCMKCEMPIGLGDLVVDVYRTVVKDFEYTKEHAGFLHLSCKAPATDP